MNDGLLGSLGEQTMSAAPHSNHAEQQRRLTELADIYYGSLIGQRSMTHSERKELAELFQSRA